MKNSTIIGEETKSALQAIRLNTKLSYDYEMYKIGNAINTELTNQVQKKEDNRAVNKRKRQVKERLTTLVGRALKPFENKYMDAYTKWGMKEIIDNSSIHPECNSLDELYEKLKGQNLGELNLVPNRRYGETENTIADKGNHVFRIWKKIDGARKLMEIESLTRFGFMREAAKGYAAKFERLIDKMVAHDFSTSFLRVEQVNNAGNELSFLITNDERAIHARAIFVEGQVVAPHYRFITTERKK